MGASNIMRGVLAPVVTPFKADLTPNKQRLIRHCRWLLSQDCGLAVFGTNSEANSLTMDERFELLDGLVEAGIDPRRMMPGTGCCSFLDSVALCKRAVEHGCGGVLMLPPFYYKDVNDEGIYRNFAEIIERVGDDRLRIYLYHFPQMSAVPFSIDLVGRLLEDFPGIVVGMKDSSGDRANLEAIMEAFPGFEMFAGNETLLLANMRLGGVGCISATANINPGGIVNLFDGWENDDADEIQKGLNAIREAVQQFPLIPAMKQMISYYGGDAEWNRLRPPLIELGKADGNKLIADLDALGFAMPGIGDRTPSSDTRTCPSR